MLRAVAVAGAMVGLMAGGLTLADETKVEITISSKPDDKVKPGDKPPFEGKRASVDVAILLDTSNSMDGLISQAKSQLWAIIQQFAKAEKNGQTPSLRVSLFEYGNTGLPASEGYIRQVVPLTDDLDKLSAALFALTTNGGDEYCGQVIDEAITRLDWSKEPGGYKAIFIAGNEPFTQGQVDYREACKRAIEKGVVVNTIHCGSHGEGVRGMWQDGAQRAEGQYFNIDQDIVTRHIECPQDKRLVELNVKLNGTYLWCGSADVRRLNAQNQEEQDANAAEAGANSLGYRVAVKGSKAYSNYGRDIVDTLAQDEDALEKLKEEELPEEMQKMTPEERVAYVEKKKQERAAVQAEIAKLAKEREEFLAKEQKRQAEENGEKTLGDVVTAAVEKQLERAGFESQE
jgi:hypothetical protein